MNAAQAAPTTSGYVYRPIDQTLNLANKRRVIALMGALTSGPIAELPELVQAGFDPAAPIHVTHPVNTIGASALVEKVWQPLRHALPDAQRIDDIVVGGYFRDGEKVACTGHYLGTFEHDWEGIPATGGLVTVRFAEVHEMQDGKIVSSYVYIDFLDLMRQAGYWPIAPSLGTEMRWMPPATHDGVVLTPQPDALSQRTIERVLTMQAALGLYNRKPPTRETLDIMGMVKHWHPHFMWYGPSGIGTTRGLAGFEDFHQIPFLVAFPDRGGAPDVGHFIRIGDGYYGVTAGWGHLQATHTGGDWLGVAPTGRRVVMRVMDFYRCDDATIVENWVPIDTPHILLQMGVDVFGRMRHQARGHKRIRVSDWLIR